MNAPSMNNIKMPPMMVFYLILGFTFLFVVFQLSKKLGLVRTREDKVLDKKKSELKEDELEAFRNLSAISAFRVDYWKTNFSDDMLSSSEAEQYAKQIKDAFHSWITGGDDEAEVYGVLRALRNRVQLSQVSNAYFLKYKEDLLGKLRDKFDDAELLIVKGIVESLEP